MIKNLINKLILVLDVIIESNIIQVTKVLKKNDIYLYNNYKVSKSILITGVAGFLGSHLCDLFVKKKFKVFGVDNLITGSLSNIAHHRNNEKFNFINHDICDQIQLDQKIDYILHLASPASPKDYLNFPIETLETGSIGTKNILDFGKKNNAIILLASTSEIYGDPIENPQKE